MSTNSVGIAEPSLAGHSGDGFGLSAASASPVAPPALEEAARALENASACEILRWAADHFHPDLAIASSFGVEDVVLIDLARQVRPDFPVFAIDTGRLPEETFAVAEEHRRRGVRVQWYVPERERLEELENDAGPYGFRSSIEARKRCCEIRKVEPLRRALAGRRAWVTGLRREQSVTRAAVAPVEWDAAHGLVKVNPLARWSDAECWAHVHERRLPYSALHDKGYPSIGCAPCTRAVAAGEHPRAGRWWWESPEHKECGLHVSPVGGSPRPR